MIDFEITGSTIGIDLHADLPEAVEEQEKQSQKKQRKQRSDKGRKRGSAKDEHDLEVKRKMLQDPESRIQYGATEKNNSFCPFESWEEYLAAHRGEYFIWDIETFPDESRFPRPLQSDKERIEIDVELILSGSADAIDKELKIGYMHEDQLSSLLDFENNSKKPRSTVAAKIMAAVANLDSDYRAWQRDGSLNPWRGRIVAFSWSFLSDTQVYTLIAKPFDDDAERQILDVFWQLKQTGTRVGYNTRAFDDKFIVARSAILKAQSVAVMDTGRYSKDNIDIMWLMFDSLNEAMSCKGLAKTLGIEPPAGDTDGSDVFRLVESGDWDALEGYSNSDVVVEKEIFKIVKRYWKV